jgi:hypothetical protein
MQRKRHSAELKAKVALEAIKGHKTVNEIKSRIRGASHANCAVEKTGTGGIARDLFSTTAERSTRGRSLERCAVSPHRSAQVELDWLKKKVERVRP